MFTDNKEKIEIINKPGLEYWPKISLYLKKNYRKKREFRCVSSAY